MRLMPAATRRPAVLYPAAAPESARTCSLLARACTLRASVATCPLPFSYSMHVWSRMVCVLSIEYCGIAMCAVRLMYRVYSMDMCGFELALRPLLSAAVVVFYLTQGARPTQGAPPAAARAREIGESRARRARGVRPHRRYPRLPEN